MPLFYTLTDGPEHIRPEANSYWRYLTPAAYDIYEQIYNECKDNSPRGWVYCKFRNPPRLLPFSLPPLSSRNYRLL